ncbi:MAG: C10 family peptidase [Muribaculum sp.]|nr:C10 family peptidase [Muribaculum sp.]
MKLQIAITLAVVLNSFFPLRASSPLNVAKKAFGGESLSPAYSRADSKVEIFNRESGGFVIATEEKVVGYSQSGSLRSGEVPDALLEMIENYGKYSIQHIAAPIMRFSAIDPLLGKIAWDQMEPYNLMCPIYVSPLRSATGCAATAMAQVMRYHAYPASGFGYHAYQPEFYPSMGTLSVDFSQSVYDWDNMPEDYRNGYNETQQNAVAKLMYDAGVAISMNYGPQSGAMSQDWPNALVEYFKYDSGVAIRYRANYDIKDWLEIIHSELANGRPVFATGFTPEGGHAFVFDGMDETGMIHVNWGWSGMSNGYFDATFLSPSTQGTGGSKGGFNSRQFIVTGIQPPSEGSEPFVGLVSEEGLTTIGHTTTDATFNAKINGKISNVGWQNSIVDFGLALIDSEGSVIKTFPGPEGITISTDTPHRNLAFDNISIGDVPGGVYRLTPMAKHWGGNKWERIRDVDTAYPNYLNVTVTGDEVTMEAPQQAQLVGKDMKTNDCITAGAKTKISLDVVNEGESEYFGALTAVLIDPATGKRIATASSSSLTIDLMPLSGCTADLYAEFSVAPGKYLLSVIDYNYSNIIKPKAVLVEASCDMSITALSAPDFLGESDVNPLDVRADAEVGCDNGIFAGHLFLYIYSSDGASIAGCLGPEFVSLSEGETTKVTFTGVFENGMPGVEYEARIINGEDFTYIYPRELSTTRFRVGDPSSTDTLVSSETSGKRYFSLQGVQLPQAPEKGIYLEVNGINIRKITKQTN